MFPFYSSVLSISSYLYCTFGNLHPFFPLLMSCIHPSLRPSDLLLFLSNLVPDFSTYPCLALLYHSTLHPVLPFSLRFFSLLIHPLYLSMLYPTVRIHTLCPCHPFLSSQAFYTMYPTKRLPLFPLDSALYNSHPLILSLVFLAVPSCLHPLGSPVCLLPDHIPCFYSFFSLIRLSPPVISPTIPHVLLRFVSP